MSAFIKKCKIKNNRRTEVANELFGVVIDQPSLLDCLLNGRKVRIGKNHVRSQLRDVRSATHGHADISLLQRRCVIDTVARLHTSTQRLRTQPKSHKAGKHDTERGALSARVLTIATTRP